MREQDRPTAIFAFNDLGAINVYRAARQHGISLPEQLSIIGSMMSILRQACVRL